MSEQVTWCTSKIAVLKLLQILCSTITFVFLIEGRGQWGAYTLIFVSSLVIGILTLLTLFAYFWRVHANNKFPWISFEIGFNLVACVLSVIFTGVLIYDSIKMFSGEFHHHRYVPPLNIGYEGWKHRILIVMVAQALNSIFYLVSLVRTKMHGIH